MRAVEGPYPKGSHSRARHRCIQHAPGPAGGQRHRGRVHHRPGRGRRAAASPPSGVPALRPHHGRPSQPPAPGLSANVNYIPRAVAAGAEIRPGCFATRIETSGGRATGVTYLDGGKERFQAAERVFVSCYAIETPRLLFNSGNLANSSDQVGRNLMVHSGPIVYGRFDRPLDSFITPPVGIMTRDPYGTHVG